MFWGPVADAASSPGRSHNALFVSRASSARTRPVAGIPGRPAHVARWALSEGHDPLLGGVPVGGRAGLRRHAPVIDGCFAPPSPDIGVEDVPPPILWPVGISPRDRTIHQHAESEDKQLIWSQTHITSTALPCSSIARVHTRRCSHLAWYGAEKQRFSRIRSTRAAMQRVRKHCHAMPARQSIGGSAGASLRVWCQLEGGRGVHSTVVLSRRNVKWMTLFGGSPACLFL